MTPAFIAVGSVRVTGAANERLNAVNGPLAVTDRRPGRCTAEHRATHDGGTRTDSAGVQ